MQVLRFLRVAAQSTRFGYQIIVSVVMSCYVIQDFLERKSQRKRE